MALGAVNTGAAPACRASPRAVKLGKQRRWQLQKVQLLLHQPRRPSEQLPQKQQQRCGRRAVQTCRAAARPVAALAAAAASSGTAAIAGTIVGWLVVAGSCFRSVPQILRILKFKSVDGLSLSLFVVESFACAISAAYHLHNAYPLSTYGDSIICLLQNFIIIALIFLLNPRAHSPVAKAATAGGLAAATVWLMGGGAGLRTLAVLEGTVVALLICSRLPQIWSNIQRGDSGELSTGSVGLSTIGNAMRVFTTLALVRDPLVLAGAASQLCLNGTLLLQTIATARRRAAAAAQPAPATS